MNIEALRKENFDKLREVNRLSSITGDNMILDNQRAYYEKVGEVLDYRTIRKPTERKCPRCGSTIDLSDRFCVMCGQQLRRMLKSTEKDIQLKAKKDKEGIRAKVKGYKNLRG